VCLLVATAAGWEAEARADVRAWSVAAAPYWALRHFVEVQAGDVLWETVLCEAEQALSERVTRGDGRPHWDVSRLRLILDARAVIAAMVTPQAPGASLAPAGESVD
jgi:hypothetical protein